MYADRESFFLILFTNYVNIPYNLCLNHKLNLMHTGEVKAITCTCARFYCIIRSFVCMTRVA